MLFVPQAIAAPAGLEVTAMSATAAGDGRFEGVLDAMAIFDRAGIATAASFSMAAQQMRVETDHADPALRVGPASIAAEPSTTHEIFKDPVLTSRGSQDQHLLEVLPSGGGTTFVLESSCTKIHGQAPDSFESEAKVRPTRDAITHDTSQSLGVEICDLATLTLTGDFLLMLWGWNATVQHEDGTAQMRTGRQESAVLPTDSEVSGSVAQAYVWATTATLKITGLDDSLRHFLVEGMRGDLMGVFSATNAGGTLHGSDTKGARWDIKGDLAMVFQSRDDAFHAAVGGELRDVRIDGRSVALPAPAPSAGWRLPWVLGGVAFLVAATLMWNGHRRGVLPTSAEHIPRLQDYAFGLVERGRRGLWTRGMLALAMRRDPWSGSAVSFLAKCHLRRGRLERALVLGRTAHEKLRGTHMVPENAARCARAASGLGHDDEAAHWLGLVHELDYARFQHMIDSNDVQAAIVMRVLRSRVPQAYA